MKHVSFLTVFSLLKSQHGGVYKGAQKTMFGGFVETKTQQSPSATRKKPHVCQIYIFPTCLHYVFVSLDRPDALGEAGWSQLGHRKVEFLLSSHFYNVF